MPPKPLFDLAILDLEATVVDRDGIRSHIPQRHEMEMLDRIIHLDTATGTIAGCKWVRDDEFWVRGHFPGRPVLPGVLLIETAGQLCSIYFDEATTGGAVLGFAAAQEVRFRGIVRPGDLVVMIGKLQSLKSRSASFQTQGFVGQTLVFEATILGMSI